MTIEIKDLGRHDTIFSQFISEIRDADIQRDSLRFRRNLERVGELMAYEISKTLPLCDPMLATGSSMVLAYKALLERGRPKTVHVATVIASDQGVALVRDHLPDNTTIWAGAVDSELTPRAYIVPGLGDAGDLAYGSKDDSA